MVSGADADGFERRAGKMAWSCNPENPSTASVKKRNVGQALADRRVRWPDGRFNDPIVRRIGNLALCKTEIGSEFLAQPQQFGLVRGDNQFIACGEFCRRIRIAS